MSYFFVSIFKKSKSAPYVSSFNKEIALMKKTLSLEKGKKIVDLGCGDGKALRFFVSTFDVKGFGYDINIWAIFLGKLLNRWFGYGSTVFLKKQDFMAISLSSFDYIYVYLLPGQLIEIEDRIWQNMKNDAVIIANSFQFVNHSPYEIIKNNKNKPSIFLYKK